MLRTSKAGSPRDAFAMRPPLQALPARSRVSERPTRIEDSVRARTTTGVAVAFDVVIRNGIVVDGSGGPRYRADIAVTGDRITRIGRVDERGAREIDAEG